MKQLTFTLIALLLAACSSAEKEKDTEKDSGQESTKMVAVSYSPSSELFPNPERGFYKHTESHPGAAPTPLNLNTLKSYRASNISLIYRGYYLKGFRNQALSDQALQQLDEDMATLRASGLKCILRFAYSSSDSEADAPLDIVLQHLEQLRPFFAKNVDVIATLQAGFIGAWGEWYYSSNNLKTPEIRAAVLNKILDVLPSQRTVQVRTPAYKTEYIQSKSPVTSSSAFKGSKAARIGHHNDCFLASPTDYGTYSAIEEEKKYINSEGLYLPVGGETCPPSGIDPADCQKAEDEMRTLRWSFLNEDYYHGVNDRWITLGCMDNIIRELGYRFTLQSGSFSDKAAPAGEIKIEFTVNNSGYACPYNPRKTEIILKNDASGALYALEPDVDARLWKPRIPAEVKISAGLPADIPEGTYSLFLNLPDPEPTLAKNPDYAIRLANSNLWDATTGFNSLNHRVTVESGASKNYSGTLFFKKRQ
ncbi:MAG: DUF4832 domain-containing protein [Bacteroidales bacterium]|jgi:hypothetical protein|nr:DUF4832 domain-containing protein [Bacteroidales bacterium]